MKKRLIISMIGLLQCVNMIHVAERRVIMSLAERTGFMAIRRNPEKYFSFFKNVVKAGYAGKNFKKIEYLFLSGELTLKDFSCDDCKEVLRLFFAGTVDESQLHLYEIPDNVIVPCTEYLHQFLKNKMGDDY